MQVDWVQEGRRGKRGKDEEEAGERRKCIWHSVTAPTAIPTDPIPAPFVVSPCPNYKPFLFIIPPLHANILYAMFAISVSLFTYFPPLKMIRHFFPPENSVTLRKARKSHVFVVVAADCVYICM